MHGIEMQLCSTWTLSSVFCHHCLEKCETTALCKNKGW